MGKGSVDENLPNFVGLFAGDGSRPDIRTAFESSDMILTIGNIKSELNTAGFTYNFSKLNTIEIHYDFVEIGHARFDKVFVRSLVPRLVAAVDPTRMSHTARVIPTIKPTPVVTSEDDAISHAWFWPTISQFLQEGDLIVTETGTSCIGLGISTCPRELGYGVGATQSVALAGKDGDGGQRTISFEGDEWLPESFQLTAQELATIIHHKLDVAMFLIELDGYTIERFVHGLDAHYNDIPKWQYAKLSEVLSPTGQETQVKTWNISSRKEIDAFLKTEAFALGKGLQVSC
ncbi:isoleucine-valine-5 [Fusarium proliferatum]|nr:isoleucine-valine-5 [Fusarium proliferatum]